MIREHGVLSIQAGREADFEAAYAQARPLIEHFTEVGTGG